MNLPEETIPGLPDSMPALTVILDYLRELDTLFTSKSVYYR